MHVSMWNSAGGAYCKGYTMMSTNDTSSTMSCSKVMSRSTEISFRTVVMDEYLLWISIVLCSGQSGLGFQLTFFVSSSGHNDNKMNLTSEKVKYICGFICIIDPPTWRYVSRCVSSNNNNILQILLVNAINHESFLCVRESYHTIIVKHIIILANQQRRHSTKALQWSWVILFGS